MEEERSSEEVGRRQTAELGFQQTAVLRGESGGEHGRGRRGNEEVENATGLLL